MKYFSSQNLLSVSVFIYGICLTQIPFYIGSPERAFGTGIFLLLMGWFAVFTSLGFSWLANPLLFFVWFVVRRGKCSMAIVAAVFTLLLMFSFPVAAWLSADPGGPLRKISDYGMGYWLWVISAVLALLSALTMQTREK